MQCECGNEIKIPSRGIVPTRCRECRKIREAEGRKASRVKKTP